MASSKATFERAAGILGGTGLAPVPPWGIMKTVVAFDTETHLIAPGSQFPQLVCVQFKVNDEPAQVLHHADPRLLPLLIFWLTDPGIILVGHNTAFDTGVLATWDPGLLPLIWDAYGQSKITDTLMREQLLNNAKGHLKARPGRHDGEWIKCGYGLSDLTRKYLGYDLDKPVKVDGMPDPGHVRLRYKELTYIPVSSWPPGFLEYALADAEATMGVYQAQGGQTYIPDEYVQAHSDFALKLMSAHGVYTDLAGLTALEAETRAAHQEVSDVLLREGLLRTGGTRNIKAAQAWLLNVCSEAGCEVPMTKPSARFPEGQPALSADALDKMDDPVLTAYAEYGVLNDILAKDIPMLREGVGHPIHVRYGFAASGRTTCSKPNLQNLRSAKGIREAFVPRPSRIFLATDYGGLELHTLAEVCIQLFGYSKLADALNEGRDPHTEIAARIMDTDYATAVALKKGSEEDQARFKNARQTGKAANFGFPGRLGERTFVTQARAQYGVTLEPHEARALKREYFSAWPEMEEYFRWVNGQKGYDGMLSIAQVGSLRQRGGMYFPAACNTMFQGLGADAAKAGLREVIGACYVVEDSLLFGCRPIAFIHDEILLEIPDDDQAHDRMEEQGRLMCLGADKYVPHVPTKVESVLMRRWSKGAKPTYNEQGRMIPYEER